jgi:hypothetical protein
MLFDPEGAEMACVISAECTASALLDAVGATRVAMGTVTKAPESQVDSHEIHNSGWK